MKTKLNITLNKLGGIVVGTSRPMFNQDLALSLQANLMRLGYIASNGLLEILQSLPKDEIHSLSNHLIVTLKAMKGDDVIYEPMYPNFPEQVMEASDLELFVNAILHYWTLGQWKPDYDKLPREYQFEATKFIPIKLVSQDEYLNIFTTILTSNDSISAGDKKIIDFFLETEMNLTFPDEIPFKENMCYLATRLYELGVDVRKVIKTSTDVLRVLTVMSDGDVSLADNTKFKSLPRRIRRYWTAVLEDVIREEDINRHRNKWVRLFHNLHVGDYSTKVFNIARKFRDNQTITTFNSKVEAALSQKDVKKASELLVNRPGDFARRLDHMLRLSRRNQPKVVEAFLGVVDQVSTRVLLQLLGNLKTRGKDSDKRIIFPKATSQKAYIIRKKTEKLSKDTREELIFGIVKTLIEKFKSQDDLGKVYIDRNLENCPMPTQQRSASEGLIQVARGTRLPLGDKSTLRFFIYWVGQDIDLNATFHDENFKMIERVSYTNLRSHKYQSCHSGDITSARNGASEFIDIDIDSALKFGARYVAMNVLVYSGPTFKEHEKCYAGWMTRDAVQSNEIYDPKTVQQKVDLNSESKNAIPVLFDLKECKAIWVDVTTPRNTNWGGNNVESNKASIEEVIEAFVESANKVNLYELFTLHTAARGEFTTSLEDADTVFTLEPHVSFDPRDKRIVTPYDINVINSEFIV